MRLSLSAGILSHRKRNAKFARPRGIEGVNVEVDYRRCSVAEQNERESREVEKKMKANSALKAGVFGA